MDASPSIEGRRRSLVRGHPLHTVDLLIEQVIYRVNLLKTSFPEQMDHFRLLPSFSHSHSHQYMFLVSGWFSSIHPVIQSDQCIYPAI